MFTPCSAHIALTGFPPLLCSLLPLYRALSALAASSTARRVSHSEITPIRTYDEEASTNGEGVVEAVALSDGGGGGAAANRGFQQGARAPSAKRNSALERAAPGSSSESGSDEESMRLSSALGSDVG